MDKQPLEVMLSSNASLDADLLQQDKLVDNSTPAQI